MQAIPESHGDTPTPEEPSSEHTRVQRRVGPLTIPVEQLAYHLFVPRRARAALLESAYELWRNVWQNTFLEADGIEEIHSDEFTRQDEIGVLSLGTRCISVTGLRWLDLSRAMGREDSYFKPWPAAAMAAVGKGLIGISSNAVVHPEWRGTLVAPPPGSSAQPARLAYLAVGLTLQRFFESAAEGSVAVTRNDRRMDRLCLSLGASSLSQIELHGVPADLMHFPRTCVRKTEPALDELWSRRHQG